MPISLLILLFSNAVTLRRDKSILFSRIVTFYANIVPLCKIILITMLVLFFIYALFILVKLAIRHLGKIVGTVIYLYSLLCFFAEALLSDLNSSIIMMVILLSFLSLYFFYFKFKSFRSKGVHNSHYLYNAIHYLYNAIHHIINDYESLLLVFITIYSAKYIINNEVIMLDSTVSRLFCSFSFLLPTYVLSRIISNSYIKYTRVPYIPLYYWLCCEIITPNNYYIKIDNLSRLTLTYYVFCSVFIMMINLESTVNLHNSHSAINDISMFTSYSFDDTVHPSNFPFDDSIIRTLNVSLSYTLNEAIDGWKETVDNLEWAPGLKHMRFDYYGDEKLFRTKGNFFYKESESYLKGRVTNYIRTNTIPQILNSNTWDTGRNNGVDNNLVNNMGVVSALKDVRVNYDSESYVDEYVMTTLTNFFYSKEGYRFAPQAKEGKGGGGKIDIQLRFLDEPRLLIEDKKEANTSWLDALSQARDYCYNDNHLEFMFVMIFKGTKFSFFFYDKDRHSDLDLDLKHPLYQDMIGIAVNHRGLYKLPQSNTYHPQMVVYDSAIDSTPTDRIATQAFFAYISHFKYDNYYRGIPELPEGDRTTLGQLGNMNQVASKALASGGTSFLGIHVDGGFNQTI